MKKTKAILTLLFSFGFMAAVAAADEARTLEFKVERVNTERAINLPKGGTGDIQDVAKLYHVKARLSITGKSLANVITKVYIVGVYDVKSENNRNGETQDFATKDLSQFRLVQALQSKEPQVVTQQGAEWIDLGTVEFKSHETKTDAHKWAMGLKYAGLVGEAYIGTELVAKTVIGGPVIQRVVDAGKTHIAKLASNNK